MGSGQSKYYRNGHNQQYPYAQQPPPPPPLYPGHYNAPFIPQYAPMPGYGAQMYPQQQATGFIPPGVYGQGSQLPPPLLNWLPQDRRKSRRSRRRESERFVGGFGGTPRRARSESRRRESPVRAPVTPRPSVEPGHRAPTPFIPSVGADEDEEDRPPLRSALRQSARYSPPHSINGDFAHVMQPLEPANPVVFGPTGARPSAPLNNPLPPPPRDIYEMSPYKALLNMPQTSALLTASYGPHTATISTNGQIPRPVERKKSIGKGLLRAFSKREKKDSQPQPNTDATDTTVSRALICTPTAQQAADLIRSMSQTRPGPANQQAHNTAQAQPTHSGVPQRRTSMAQSTHSADNVFPPVPPMPSSPPAVWFSQESPGPYGVFMNHSPHRVLYRNVTYPTAAHLYEAMKFIDTRQTDLSSSYVRIGRKALEFLEEALFLKFRQHPDLRLKLLGTGDARIIYSNQKTHSGASMPWK
ncbi:GTP cyclohydrolase II [Pholiota molesta]|nr:GTP cyclohydrolase II [Pholiota molesta]